MSEDMKKPFYKRWWFIAIVVLLIIGIFANMGDDDDMTNENEEIGENNDADMEEENVNDENEVNEEVVEDDATEDEIDEEQIIEEETPEEEVEIVEEENGDQVSFGPGMYVVNDEIEAGLYRNEDGITYWERLSGFSGELDDIIANNLPEGPAYVEILSSDAAFNSQGSGEWIKIEDDYEGELLTEFGDGQYLVGVDIEPGKYKNDQVTSSFGYWARLSGFTGNLEDIISNDNVENSVIVEISSNDVGFETSGAGTWKKLE